MKSKFLFEVSIYETKMGFSGRMLPLFFSGSIGEITGVSGVSKFPKTSHLIYFRAASAAA
jgi:hypothetical protein